MWYTVGSKTVYGTGIGIYGQRMETKYFKPIGRCAPFNVDRATGIKGSQFAILSERQAVIFAWFLHYEFQDSILESRLTK